MFKSRKFLELDIDSVVHMIQSDEISIAEEYIFGAALKKWVFMKLSINHVKIRPVRDLKNCSKSFK